MHTALKRYKTAYTTNTILKFCYALLIVTLSLSFYPQITMAHAASAPLNQQRQQSISGAVYLDKMPDGAYGPGDELLPNVRVFAQSEATDVLYTTTTNANGHYILTSLPYGFYRVWCENTDGHVTPSQRVEVNEVMGFSDLNLVFERVFRSFLPVVSR